MQDKEPALSTEDTSTSQPPPVMPLPKPVKRDVVSMYSPTEDSFQDTANLVKEDSDI